MTALGKKTATPTHITGIRTVSIPVDDQDTALRVLHQHPRLHCAA